jgi:hypothetical protein
MECTEASILGRKCRKERVRIPSQAAIVMKFLEPVPLSIHVDGGFKKTFTERQGRGRRSQLFPNESDLCVVYVLQVRSFKTFTKECAGKFRARRSAIIVCRYL